LNENSTAYRAPVEHGHLAWAAFGPSHGQLQHSPDVISVTTILDFAEIATFQMFPDPRKAADHANDWAAHLHLRANGKSLPLQVQGIRSEIVPAPAANDEANGVFMDAEIQQMMEKARL
jgi:hypothetical protein